MQKRKLILAALAVSSIGVIPVAASAAVYVMEAPPAPRHEVVPHERHGYVWAPGYWDYRHHHYVWVQGHWVREKHGMYWHPNRWVQHDGRWEMQGGKWDRERYVENRYGDRDHDGVPNRADRDRDGDGVTNNHDRAPDNPHRQ